MLQNSNCRVAPARRAPAKPRSLAVPSVAATDGSAAAKVRILVVDGDRPLRESCASAFRLNGHEVHSTGRGDEAVAMLRRRGFDIILADLHTPHVDGLALLHAALATNADALVIITTATPDVEASINLVRLGAWDYLPKPFSPSHLHVLIGRAAHTAMQRRAARQPARAPETGTSTQDLMLLGTAPAFRHAVALTAKVAATNASVFITGESGCGKELFARYVHTMSRRATESFVPVNCAALPESLLESEMFGHCKGSFTGAMQDKRGLLEMAHAGTLFLDELVEMPTPSQAKLLRVIQDGVVRRVGSTGTDAVVDVRFVAATNVDPEDAIARGTLREDLYYRLRVVRIHVPPLRERAEDILALAGHFLSMFWARHRDRGSRLPEFTEAAIGAMNAYAWPGNVRELQNVVENVAVLADPGSRIGPEDLMMPEEQDRSRTPDVMPNVDVGPYRAARERLLAQFDAQYLAWLLDRTAGNMSEGARIAGVDRTTLYRLLDRHGLFRVPHTTLCSASGDPAAQVTE
jgi:DNA-binding NtrC family response regulator